jgi:glycosyltransferase involved in cell wall biosynthesis
MSPTGDVVENGSTDRRGPRIAVLWTQMSGYVHAQLDALTERGVEVVLFHRERSTVAPFETPGGGARPTAYEWSEAPDEEQVEAVLRKFDPDAVLVNSWHLGPYRRAARRLHGRTLRVLCMDNQWWGTAKQWAGVATARWWIRPAYDAVMLPGDRQAELARRLGFSTEEMIWGLYSGQPEPFERIAAQRDDGLPPRAFLFVGRLVHDKAVDVLVDGYTRYRAASDRPWPLIVAGTGPDAELLAGVPGVETLGFVQPSDLPAVFARAGCLVLPSRFEPWAVVVHEATCAQLPVVCTWVCGASTRLVLDGQNGVVISPDDADALAGALRRIEGASDDERRAMGALSGLLSRQYSPERWADNLLRRVPQLRQAAGLSPRPDEIGSRARADG